MFLEDVPMEFKIIDGERLVWSRRYRGVDYIYSYISLGAAMEIGTGKELKRFDRLMRKEINKSNNGIVFL